MKKYKTVKAVKAVKKEDNFAEMLEKSFTPMKALEPGQSVETEILSISGDSIFIHLNGKSEGILEKDEFLDKEGNLTVQEGDVITAYFLKAQNGELRFTTRISGNEAGQAVLENAYEQGIPVEGVVEKEIKGGFEIKLGESRAFCPYSQMGSKRVEDASEYLGRHMTFKIMEHSEKGRNILVSNRAILEEKKEQKVADLKKTLKEGMTISGPVISLRDFGAFVDLNGVQALLPISEISRSRVDNVSDMLEEGQEITAKIMKLDWQNERISISMRELEADPWDNIHSKYKRGERYSGTVARITDFGAFVTLEPGVDGLIHISDMKSDNRDNSPADLVKKGKAITVQINSIDADRKRISLKPLSSTEEDQAFQQYIQPDQEESGDTYNPFAALLKDKVKKKK